MASLIRDLITVLEEEEEIYEYLLPITREKKQVIIKNDLQSLQNITVEEQKAVDILTVLERRREEVIVNIGTVLGMDAAVMKITDIIRVLDKQPQEQKELIDLDNRLRETVGELKRLNEMNRQLLEQTLEMIAFDLNVLQSMKGMPLPNNYTKAARQQFDVNPYNNKGMFDAKQ